MTHAATKLVIITEKLIEEGVTRIIAEAGATGYTVVAAGGKGSRGVKSSSRAAVVAGFGNVKIEVIAADRAMAEAIADRV
ncbi:MAG: hypothetical protein AAFW69_12380, partial [Pseudomonadota bacterium]